MKRYNFDALEDFEKSLDEINVLVRIAGGYKTINRQEKRILILRSAVLFLGTHLECFFESIAEEYLYKIEQLSLPRDKIPQNLLMSSVDYLFNDSLIKKVKNKNPSCREQLVKLAEVVSCSTPVTELKIDTSFSYGKHGSGVVDKLFKRLDVEDVFDNSPVYEEIDTMLADEPESRLVNIKSKFDILTSIRNGLIHEYSAPNESIINSILSDIKFYKLFGESLSNYLCSKLEQMEKVAEVQLA